VKKNYKMLGLALAGALSLASASAETVKVGVIATSSGPFARWGEQFQQAIQVYQKIHGDTVNGNKIEIIYRDDGGPDPARVKQLAEGLILRDKVKFLAGFVFTPNALAVADLVTESQTPTVIFNASTAMVIRKSPYFVRTSHTIPQVARPIAEWAYKNGIKRVVTAVSDYAPGFDAEQAFSRIFKAAGGEIMESIHIPLATTDFSLLRADRRDEARCALHFRTGRTADRRHDQHLGRTIKAGRRKAALHGGDAGNRPAQDRPLRAGRRVILPLHGNRRQSAQQVAVEESHGHVRTEDCAGSCISRRL